MEDVALGSINKYIPTGQAAEAKGRGGRIAGGILGFLALFLLLGAAVVKCAPPRRTRQDGMNALAGTVKTNASFDPFAGDGTQLAGPHGMMSRRGGSIIITNKENVTFAVPMEIQTDEIAAVSGSSSSGTASPATLPEGAYAEVAYAVPMEIKTGGIAAVSGSSSSDGAPPATLPEGPYIVTRAVELHHPTAAVSSSTCAPPATLPEVAYAVPNAQVSSTPSNGNNGSEFEKKGDYLEPSAQQRAEYDESKTQQGRVYLAPSSQQVIVYDSCKGSKPPDQSMLMAANESSL